ncbi:MAG: VanZ family protein [Thermoleophilia bacterium]
MNDIPAKHISSSWRVALPWLSVIAWAALIFFLSAQPNLKTDLGIWDLILRKGAHMVEFAVLCLLLWNAIRQTVTVSFAALAFAVAISLLYAFSDEFHQRFVPGRSGALRDVAFDAIGIVIMSVIIIALRPNRTAQGGTPAI